MYKTLNITQLAIYTGIKKRTLYNMIAEKRFPVQPLKGTNPRLWNKEAVDSWLGGQHD